jgi:WS/DGAT/MGAT family acyltransferase
MQQLTGMDGMFLSVDTPTSTGVMGGLMLFDPPKDPEAGGAARVVERIESRLDAIPPFRWVLTGVPIGINNAYWTEVDHVDVPAHVHEVDVAAPGTDHEVAELVASIMQTPLPKDRPLWDYTVIRGLSGGRLAHLIRIHHGVIDGGTVPTVLDLLSDHPTVEADPKDAPGRRSIVPAKVEVAARGVVGAATVPLRLLGLQARTAKYLIGRRKDDGLLALPAFLGRMLPGQTGKPINVLVNGRRKKLQQNEVQPLIPVIKTPSSPFNGRITANRSYAFSDLPLADFKTVGKAFGATLNDAVVAVCAGALRRYMLSIGEVPTEPLIVCIPSSLRTGDEKERWTNHISMFFAEFPTHLDDPQARLDSVHTDLKAAKENFDALPTHLFRDAMRFVPQVLWNSSVKLLGKAPEWMPGATWNVVVSNVRGPSHTVEVCGATMTGYWPAAFLTPGIGLNITLQSYKDRVDFGFMGCTDLVPDLWDMPRYMAEELKALLALAKKQNRASRIPATAS